MIILLKHASIYKMRNKEYEKIGIYVENILYILSLSIVAPKVRPSSWLLFLLKFARSAGFIYRLESFCYRKSNPEWQSLLIWSMQVFIFMECGFIGDMVSWKSEKKEEKRVKTWKELFFFPYPLHFYPCIPLFLLSILHKLHSIFLYYFYYFCIFFHHFFRKKKIANRSIKLSTTI